MGGGAMRLMPAAPAALKMRECQFGTLAALFVQFLQFLVG